MVLETVKKWTVYHSGLVTEVKISLPRDCLQAERSLLQNCKFAGILGLSSLTFFLDLSFDTTGLEKSSGSFLSSRRFTIITSLLFFVLAMSCLGLQTYNYFNTIYRMIEQKGTHGTGTLTQLLVFSIIMTLIGLNVVLLVGSK